MPTMEAANQSMNVDQLLLAWAGALGGLEALRRVPCVHKRGRVRAFGTQGHIEEWITAAGGFRQQFVLDSGLGALLAIDDDGAWIKRGPRAEPLAGATGALYRALANIERLWALLPDRLPGTIEAASPSGDGDAHTIVWRAPGAAPVYIHLRRDTHLPARFVAGDTDSRTEVALDDWRAAGGMLVAFRRVEREVAYGNEFVVEYEGIRAASAPAAGWFGRPQDDPPDYVFVAGQRTPAIPFELSGNKIYFRARLGQAPPVPLVLDSGASGPACLDAGFAREIGLHLEGAVTGGGAGPGTVAAQFTRGLTLELPGLTLHDQVAEIAPLDDLLGPIEGRRLYGLFGGALLTRFVLAVDYVARTLTLHEPEGYTDPGTGMRIPVTLDAGCPYLQATVTLPGRPPATGTFLVDLAADDAVCLTSPFVDAHRLLEPHQDFVFTTTGWGLGGELREYAGRGRLQLGGFEFADAVMLLSQDSAGAMSSDAFSGVIGGEVLRRFDVVLAAALGYLGLTPNAHFAQPFEFDMSGLALRAEPPDYRAVRIAGVRPHSPAAEAGLQPGDEIVALDGRPAGALGLDTVRQLFLRAGRQCPITVKRAADELAVTLVTRRAL